MKSWISLFFDRFGQKVQGMKTKVIEQKFKILSEAVRFRTFFVPVSFR